MNSMLTISPVLFAVTGLLIFILGQFQKPGMKIVLSIAGLLFVGLFVYKLLMIKNGTGLAIAYPGMGNKNFGVSIFEFYYIGVVINIIGLILWLFAILHVAFEKSISKQSQFAILIAGGLVILTSLAINQILGNIVGAICFPILSIGFFAAYKMKFNTLKVSDAA